MNTTAGGRAGIVKDLPINTRIRAKEVRLIGEQGEQLGVMPLQRALQIAYEHGLDLVEVAPKATPPVCRILDYGKYRYEQTKKERKARRGQRVGLLREVRLRPKIEEHDLQAKIRTTRKLLEEGNKVRVVLRFKGREATYPELGWKVLRRVTEASKDIAVVSNSVNDPMSIAVILHPVSQKKSKGPGADAKTQNP